MLAHLGYGTVPHASLIHPALALLVVGLTLFSRLRMGRGEIAPASPFIAMLPAFALVIFFGVLVTGNVVCGGPANLMTLVPLLLLCLLAWRRVPVWAVAALSVLALGGWWLIGPRVLYVLAPVTVYGLFVLLDRLNEPLSLRLALPAVVVALAAWSFVLDEADTNRTARYWELWEKGDRAALTGHAEGADVMYYAAADNSRPHDTFGLYCSIREMTILSGKAPAQAVRLFEHRMPRLISEFEEVTHRDPEWATPREDLARLHILRGELPQAIDQYREILRWRPADRAAMSMLGYLLLRNGEVEEAEGVLTRVLRFRKPPVEAMINLGVVRFHRGRDAEARKLWEEARSCRPAHPAAGWNTERLKDPSDDRGTDTIYLACPSTPAVAPWINDLAAYSQTPSARDKVRLLIEATQFDPLLTRAHLNLARVYLTREGSLYDAKRALWHARCAEEAARNSKNSAEVVESLLLLGEALLANGRPEEARGPLEEGKARAPAEMRGDFDRLLEPLKNSR
jgi:tetratricopeptide (TPR) repeat protein